MTVDELHLNTEANGYRSDLDRQYAPGPTGSGNDFGVINKAATESRLLALPVRIAHGEHRGQTNGYGLRHILLGHGEELAADGWASVQDFILCVLDEFNKVYVDASRPNRRQLVWSARTEIERHCILVIELDKSEEFYRIITGYTREGRRRLRDTLVWERRDRSTGPG